MMSNDDYDNERQQDDTTMSATTAATAAAAESTTGGPSSAMIKMDRSNMVQYYGKLRRFTPQELLKLFGFPSSSSPQQLYEFPPSTSNINMDVEHQYKLIGNSINVTVVTELMKELLLFDTSAATLSRNGEPSTDSSSDNVIDDDGWQYYSSVDEWMMATNNLTNQDKEEEEESLLASMGTALQLDDGHLMVANGKTSPTAVDGNGETIRSISSSSSSSLVVGKGCKGHIIETIHDINLIKLYQHYRWKPLPNCTGRYTCRDHKLVSKLPPIAMLQQAGITTTTTTTSTSDGNTIPLKEYCLQLPGRNDQVSVVPLDETNTVGVISFVKNDMKKTDTNDIGQQTYTNSNNGEERQQQQRPTSYVHTLNTPSGFRRKLEAIGIKVTSNNIWHDNESI